MINLELPKKIQGLATQARQVAAGAFRPISRKYDRAEHTYPKELEMFAALMQGMNAGNQGTGGISAGAGAGSVKKTTESGIKNGANMATIAGITEMCWGDVGLLLTIPNQGLGNAAISAVANAEQKQRFEGRWAAMAITEPEAGSDSAAIRTTAVLDGDEWVLNGEKIYVTCGERADLVVVWATLDRNMGRAAIKSFVVERGTAGMNLERLEKKLGIRASDTAALRFVNCRIPKTNLLGDADIDVQKSFAGAMKTFDNTRPMVAAMALGVTRAALDRTQELLAKNNFCVDFNQKPYLQNAIQAEIFKMEAEYEAARLLTLKAAWMADNGQANAKEASMSKAKAGRTCNAVTLKCVELVGALAYGEDELLEKWARDSKILDIFEGTQQIQLLVVARQILGLSSAQLK